MKKLFKFLKSKKAVGSIATAIKAVTAVVCGATILVGGYGIVNDVVLPATEDKVVSVAEYSGNFSPSGGGGSGDTGGGNTEIPVPDNFTGVMNGKYYVNNVETKLSSLEGTKWQFHDEVTFDYGSFDSGFLTKRFNTTPIWNLSSNRTLVYYDDEKGYLINDGDFWFYSNGAGVETKNKKEVAPIIEISFGATTGNGGLTDQDLIDWFYGNATLLDVTNIAHLASVDGTSWRFLECGMNATIASTEKFSHNETYSGNLASSGYYDCEDICLIFNSETFGTVVPAELRFPENFIDDDTISGCIFVYKGTVLKNDLGEYTIDETGWYDYWICPDDVSIED